MMEITIRVSDELGKRLAQVQDQLPGLLERALAEQDKLANNITADEREIIELLTSAPAPQTVLALKPSARFQQRVSDLLERSKRGELGHAEDLELDRYLYLEHWVRLAKAHAYQQLAQAE